MDNMVLELGRRYFYFLLMAVGALVIAGSVLNWEWISRIGSPTKLGVIREFVEKLWGMEARLRFERLVMLLCGVVIFLSGVFYWHIYGK